MTDVTTTDRYPDARDVIDAIRSGNYHYGFGSLSYTKPSGARCFCVAGIAADIAVDRAFGTWETDADLEHLQVGRDGIEWYFRWDGIRFGGSLPEEMCRHLGGSQVVDAIIRKWDSLSAHGLEFFTPDNLANWLQDQFAARGVYIR